MYKDLKNKVAIVTGGNGVLGGSIAVGLAKNGVRIGILGRTKETVDARVQEINEKGFEAISLVADVLDEESLEEVKEKIIAEWGKIDILVNGAGGNNKGATIMPDQTFFDLSTKDMDNVNQLNFKGTWLPCLVFGKEIIKQEQGSIVNISSIAAQYPLTRVVGYSAAKASIENFTKWLAVEMASKYDGKLRVNAIAPGFYIGEQNRSLLLKEDGELTARGETIISKTPMKRFGEKEELQGVTNWLVSNEASFVTGIVVHVDGGFSAFSGV